MNEDIKRLLTIIKRAPTPFGKTDSELAQEYRNWFLGSRLNLKAAEQSFAADGARRCPACKTLLEDRSVYCDNCGTDTPRS